MSRAGTLLLTAFLLLTIATVTIADDVDCVYTFFVRTGSIFKAGTDSIISAKLADSYGNTVEIADLEAWGGLMGEGYNYYERSNLDIFSGRAACLPNPFCSLNLTSDGSGDHHGWYANYVEVTATGVHGKCVQQSFTIEQWLALDVAPYELTAVRDYCWTDEGSVGKIRVGSDKPLLSIV